MERDDEKSKKRVSSPEADRIFDLAIDLTKALNERIAALAPEGKSGKEITIRPGCSDEIHNLYAASQAMHVVHHLISLR